MSASPEDRRRGGLRRPRPARPRGPARPGPELSPRGMGRRAGLRAAKGRRRRRGLGAAPDRSPGSRIGSRGRGMGRGEGRCATGRLPARSPARRDRRFRDRDRRSGRVSIPLCSGGERRPRDLACGRSIRLGAPRSARRRGPGKAPGGDPGHSLFVPSTAHVFRRDSARLRTAAAWRDALAQGRMRAWTKSANALTRAERWRVLG